MGVDTKTKKTKHFKKSRKVISFEEEVVTRDQASKYLQDSSSRAAVQHNLDNNDEVKSKVKKKKYNNVESELTADEKPANDQDISEKKSKKQKRKKRKEQESNIEDIPQTSSFISESEPPKNGKKRKKQPSNSEEIVEETTVIGENEPQKKGKKRKKKALLEESADSVKPELADVDCDSPEKRKKCEEEAPTDTADAEATKNVNTAKEKSKRLLKREKHLKLVGEKKLKSELHFQQKALEYLSRWKHSRSTWRFEKLKQIWLQQNLFEPSKIPSEFWDSILEYFTSARGKVKSILIEKALKIMEENKPEESKEDNDDNLDQATEPEESENNHEVNKMKRARDIVQYLQEE